MSRLRNNLRFGSTIEEGMAPYVELAEKLGYEIDSGVATSLHGYTFTKGHVHIWGIMGGWQVADLYPPEHDPEHDYFQNHRGRANLEFVLLKEAYKAGGIPK